MTTKNVYKGLSYSIRKCNEDEIEIRYSVLDGFFRGFLRLLFLGIFCMSWYYESKYGDPPFNIQIETVKEDFMWTFNKDKRLLAMYEEYREWELKPETKATYPNAMLLSYEEYKKLYTDEPWAKWHIIRTVFHFIWIPFLCFLLCLPRPRGVRINRKKRVIYAPHLGGKYQFGFVPNHGDPLGGVIWSRYGVHPWGFGQHFSLAWIINDEKINPRAQYYLGVYPNMSASQNDNIQQAVRAYLTEKEPEFLNHIGYRFNTLCTFNLLIPFCNAFALPMCFSRKKADKAIDNALKKWNQKTSSQQIRWFKKCAEGQAQMFQGEAELGLYNPETQQAENH